MATRKTGWTLLLVALLFPLLIALGTANASSDCSLGTLKGTYGFVGHGTILAQLPGLPPPPALTAGSGIATFDGNGNLSVEGTQNINGAISTSTEPATGTYTVNSDCTYSDELTVPGGPVFHEAGTITGQGIFQEIHIIDIDPWFINVLTLKKTPSSECSLETLKGTYSGVLQGTFVGQFPGFPPPPLPWAEITTHIYDGEGHFTGENTAHLGGAIIRGTFTGTYTVNSNCSYSAELKTNTGVVINDVGTITGSGTFREVQEIWSVPGTVVSGTLQKTARRAHIAEGL